MRGLSRAFRSRAFALSTVTGLAAIASLTAACGDVTALEATAENVHAVRVVYPLTGSAPFLPTAFNTAEVIVSPVGPSGNFDIAFDLDEQRRVVIYPAGLVVQPLAGIHQVGLLKVAGAFESLERAPDGPYVNDEPLAVNLGEVVAIQAQRNRPGDICGFAISPNIFSKLVVDSVSAGTNAIWFRFVVNPNCGFRSFATGLPRD